jgi:hypothetical protein
LFLPHDLSCAGCREFARVVAERESDLAAEQGRLVVIVPAGSQPSAGEWPELRTVVDDDNGLRSTVGVEHGMATVVVADQYGQVFLRRDVDRQHRFPPVEELVDCLLGIAISCPECGVPDVPSPDVLPGSGASSAGMRLDVG